MISYLMKKVNLENKREQIAILTVISQNVKKIRGKTTADSTFFMLLTSCWNLNTATSKDF